MKLKKGSISSFAQHVKKSGKGLIVYGAGVIGEVAAPYWLHHCQLDKAVLCYVDADVRKQGTSIQLGARSVPVRSLAALEEHRGRYILLITVSAFMPVAASLEQTPGTEEAEAYFLPVMLVGASHASRGRGVVRTSEYPLIPKKIHYCWFSGAPIPEHLQHCIDSWKRFCPDYEIIRWDESNYDIDRYPYIQQAYQQKKWGFVPDLARLDILYRHGGIYLDTDVELLRSLDDLLFQPAFCSVEKWGTINMGGCSGARPNNPVIRKILECRENTLFYRQDGTLNLTTCGYYETLPMIPYGFEVNGQTQTIADGQMTVYSSEFFHPFDYMSGETALTPNTFSIHHFSGTWLGPEAAEKRAETRRNYQEFLGRLEETI